MGVARCVTPYASIRHRAAWSAWTLLLRPEQVVAVARRVQDGDCRNWTNNVGLGSRPSRPTASASEIGPPGKVNLPAPAHVAKAITG
jgi:hypothetical protein